MFVFNQIRLISVFSNGIFPCFSAFTVSEVEYAILPLSPCEILLIFPTFFRVLWVLEKVLFKPSPVTTSCFVVINLDQLWTCVAFQHLMMETSLSCDCSREPRLGSIQLHKHTDAGRHTQTRGILAFSLCLFLGLCLFRVLGSVLSFLPGPCCHCLKQSIFWSLCFSLWHNPGVCCRGYPVLMCHWCKCTY